jgi:beta-glucanase (GH16 family)
MWRIKDFIINLYLRINLYFKIKLKKNYNVINCIDKENWDLTFNDEFNGVELDRSKWRTDAYYGYRYHYGSITNGNAPVSYYADDLNLIEDNKLVQLAINVPKTIEHVDWNGVNHGEWTIPYQVGQIDNSNIFKQQYGYFEIRSKISDQPGGWPAFWLASTFDWPPEIDVYEIYTGSKHGLRRFDSNFHWKNKKNKHKFKVGNHFVHSVSEDFHTYACEWTDKYFKIYYDNILVRIFSNPIALKAFKYPMHIIINNAIHTEQGPENAIYPTKHIVDYVRAYKKK